MRALTIGSLLALLLLGACGAPAGPRADITIGDAGCDISSFTLAADREPVISIASQASEAMVFTLPRMNRWVSLPPGGQADFELPRYIMGDFEFFCLTDADHLALSGGNPFLCSLEPGELAPVARSSGSFSIAPHDRIREVTGGSGG